MMAGCAQPLPTLPLHTMQHGRMMRYRSRGCAKEDATMRGIIRLLMPFLAGVPLLVACGGSNPTATIPVPTSAPTATLSATGTVPRPTIAPIATTAIAAAATTAPTTAGAVTRVVSATGTGAQTTPSPAVVTQPPQTQAIAPTIQEYPVPSGSGPHDVAPAPDGTIWYTAQRSGELGRLDPKTGETKHVKLGKGSAPHGVIVGPDGAPWVTDGGLNAIV